MSNMDLYREAYASLTRLQRSMQMLAYKDGAADRACDPIANAIEELMKAESNVARTDYGTHLVAPSNAHHHSA